MKQIFTIILLLLAVLFVEARHIIGGEITYECLGDVNGVRRYRFTMRVYRDCYSGGAPFDGQNGGGANIGVYRCGVNQDCGDLTQFNALTTLQAPLRSVRSVDPPNFSCLELPRNVCVEEGLYQFELSLPIVDESYHIVYQRCCRNETISNITAPGDAGATYSVEITPTAQQLCNSSPTFNQFPPIVICVDQPLEFDHSATDSDGDQLVYSFCAPQLGGGKFGTPENPGDAGACNGVIPSPPCPPPFDEVRFVAPTYNFLRPLGGQPQVTINTNTGVITGTPNQLGQFVVGVCVQEYRDGVLLSELKRDFQFNVTNCQPTVIADIQKDSIIGGKQYLVNSCGNNTIRFINESYQRQFIDTYSWQFDIEGEIETFSAWDAVVTFPDTGRYQGILVLNPNTECGDTANIFVNIYPEITADFEFEYDTCIAGPVAFTDLSVSGAGDIVKWNWEFGDGNASSSQNPEHTYGIPGNLPVTLSATDINRCTDEITKTVNYFPVPGLIVVAPSEFTGCVPADIFFDNLSTPIDETYDIRWDFGDGDTGSDISPTHEYDEVGTFTVAVEITSPIGCKTDTIFTNLITTLPSPTADFSFFPTELSNLDPTASFTDLSREAVSWQWNMGNIATLSEQNPTFTFPDTGRQAIQLIVTHPSGCQDSITQFLDIVPDVRYFLPNAFTPNSDGSNDFFRGTGVLTGVQDFSFTIWNRWGEKVFETSDPEEAWNGKKNNSGQDLPNGVYVCIVQFEGPRGERYEFQEFATLIR